MKKYLLIIIAIAIHFASYAQYFEIKIQEENLSIHQEDDYDIVSIPNCEFIDTGKPSIAGSKTKDYYSIRQRNSKN